MVFPRLKRDVQDLTEHPMVQNECINIYLTDV